MLTMDKVLDRAAKFLAMRENRGASEAEAAAAAEHLQRLLQEHNLTLSQVEMHQDGENTPVAKRVKERLTAGLSRSRRWQMTLLEGIAKNNFCITMLTKRRNPETGKRWGDAVLVGREVNVVSTKMTYDYIATILLRAQKEYEATLPGLAEMTSNDKREKYWFFMDGAVSRIIERLNEQRAQREAEDAAKAAPSGNGTGRELVLSDVYGSEIDLNNDHLNGFPPGTTATRRRENDARVARQEAELARLTGEGVEWAVAWYRSHGYDEHAATAAAADYERQSRRTGRHRHSAQNWSRRDESHYRKVTSTAYKAGRVKGEDVGLDSQVGASTTKKLT